MSREETPEEAKAKSRNALLGYLSAFGAAVLIGVYPSVSKPLLVSVNPLFFSSIVTLAPAVLFTPLSFKVSSSRSFGRRIYLTLAATSIIGSLVGPYVYFLGLQRTTAADASLLTNSEMIFTILIASLFLKERLNRIGLVSIILVTLGVAVIVTDLNFSSSILNVQDSGHLLILASGFLWGLDNNILTSLSKKVHVVRIAQFKSLIGGGGLLLLTFFVTSPQIRNFDIFYIFLIGLLVLGVALYLNIQSLKWIGAIRTTMIFPLSSIFGVFFAYLLLHEQISIFQIISMLVILFGVYLLTRRESVRT